jgi:hypothetical protein
MIARNNTIQSNLSTLAPTNSDSVFLKKTSFYKNDSITITYSSTDDNKIQPEKIKVTNSKNLKAQSMKPPSNRNSSIKSDSNSSSNLLKIKSNKKQIKIIDENNNEFTLKPILKNKNKKRFIRPVNRNVTEYQGKSIKFVDQVIDINKPLAHIMVVESYREFNKQTEHIPKEIPEGKEKADCSCACSIF